jgi:hypothetical protein
MNFILFLNHPDMSLLRRAAPQALGFGVLWLKDPAQRTHQGLRLGGMVATKVAHVHIQRHRLLLGPRMDTQMRFGQQHGGRYTTWAVRRRWESVKQLRYCLQAAHLDCFNTPWAE